MTELPEKIDIGNFDAIVSEFVDFCLEFGVDELYESYEDVVCVAIEKNDDDLNCSSRMSVCENNCCGDDDFAHELFLDKQEALNFLASEMQKVDLPIKNTAKNFVFGEGDINSRVMLIGEAPGEDEDIQGRPFVGRSGQLLEKIFKSVGFERDSMYITNILPWRPPFNRQPTLEEIQLFLPFVLQHILVVCPDVVVAVGGVSAKALLATEVGITKIKGNFYDLNFGELLIGKETGRDMQKGKVIKIFPVFHPSYLLRCPGQQQEALKDFGKLRAWIDDSSGK